MCRFCWPAQTERLNTQIVRWKSDTALTVVLAAKGYPGAVKKQSPINGLDGDLGATVEVFHAGTAKLDGAIVSNGGRVLNVTATGPTAKAAQTAAYAAVEKIDYPDGFCRRDIGWRAV